LSLSLLEVNVYGDAKMVSASMATTPAPENILSIPTTTTVPTPLEVNSYDPFRDTDTPIVIDNGATTLRWGFAAADSPACQPNIITKYKERKTNRPLLLFGDAVEFEGGAKAQARTPWEGDVLLNFDALVRSVPQSLK